MNRQRVGGVLVVALAVVLGWVQPASATWSLVGVDPDTGEVGVAIASCVEGWVLGKPDKTLLPVVLVPGQGAAVTQGLVLFEAPSTIRTLLNNGVAAPDVVASLTEETFDDSSESRQYGIVRLQAQAEDAQAGEAPRAAVFNGDAIEAETAAIAGDTFAVVGLLLPDQKVASRAAEAFETAQAEGLSLDASLLEGLKAGSGVGGDKRCEEQTALVAHLAVAKPGDDPVRPSTLLTVTVDADDGQNPVLLLDDAFDRGDAGWVNAGTGGPSTLPKIWVAGVMLLIGVAAVFVFRHGMGNTKARR